MNNLQEAINDLTDSTQKELCQSELDNLQTKLNFFFDAHEHLMVRLCRILKLDYVEAKDEDVVAAVKTIMDTHRDEK